MDPKGLDAFRKKSQSQRKQRAPKPPAEDEHEGDESEHEDEAHDHLLGFSEDDLSEEDREHGRTAREEDEDGQNPPSWVVDESTWSKAKEAVDPDGAGADKYDDPWAVVAYVYKKTGGGTK